MEELKDLSKLDFLFKPGAIHLWRQQGYYIVCSSCELQHAMWIGEHQILVGIKEGAPILKSRAELGLV